MPTAIPSELDPLTKRLLNIEITLNDIESSIKIHYRRLRDNLLEIIHGLEAEFPIKTKEDREKRAMAFYTLKWMLQGPAVLFSLGMNGPAIVDLHGYIEQYAVRDASFYLSSGSQPQRQVIRRLLEHHSLRDLAIVMEGLQVWDKSDRRLVENLTELRNTLAHKNPRKISNLLLSGKPVKHFSEIDRAAQNIDFPKLYAKCARLLVKSYETFRQSRVKGSKSDV